MRMYKLPPVDGYDDESMADELGVDASKQPDIPPQPDASLDDIAPPEAKAKPDAMDMEIMRQLEAQPQGGGAPPMPMAALPGTDDARAEKDAIAEGRQRDDNARLMRGIELGGKQLIAGVLHQDKVAEVVSPESTNYEGQAKADAERGEAKRYQRSQGEIAAAHQRYLTTRQLQNDELSRKDKDKAATRQGEQDKHSATEHDEDQVIRKDQNKAMLAMAGAQFGFRKDEHQDNEDHQSEQDVQKLAKETGANPALIAQKVARVNDVLKRHPDDIPGVGPVDSRTPRALLSADAQSIQSDAKELVNTLLFMQSGAGVSQNERDNKYSSYGINEGGTEEAFKQGMMKLQADLAAELKSRQAGFRPDVIKTFQKRGGVLSGDVAHAGQGGTTPAAVKVGSKATNDKGQTIQWDGSKWQVVK